MRILASILTCALLFGCTPRGYLEAMADPTFEMRFIHADGGPGRLSFPQKADDMMETEVYADQEATVIASDVAAISIHQNDVSSLTISLELTDLGRDKLQDRYDQLPSDSRPRLGLMVNGVVLLAPTVMEMPTGNKFMITSGDPPQESEALFEILTE